MHVSSNQGQYLVKNKHFVALLQFFVALLQFVLVMLIDYSAGLTEGTMQFKYIDHSG